MDIQAIVAVAVPVGAVGVWLLRLEGRHNSHEAACAEREKNHEERHVGIQQDIAEIKTDIKELLRR